MITMYGIGEHEGNLYLVFEYLTGGTLADRLAKSGRLPWQEAALSESRSRALSTRSTRPASFTGT